MADINGIDFNDTEALVFDMDYTLIDSSAGIVYCFNWARREAGEPEVEPHRIKAYIGLTLEHTFSELGSSEPHAMRLLYREAARRGEVVKRTFLLPGVEQAIPAIHDKGYRLAVASTKSHYEIERTLETLGILRYFEQIVGSDEVQNPKPAPDALLLVTQKMGVSPAKAVYVGDHVVDVKAARGAGMRSIAIEGGPCSREQLQAQNPDLFLAATADLPELL